MTPGMQKVQQQRQKIKNAFLAGMIPEAFRSLRWEQRAVEATQQAAHKATFREDMAMPEDDEGTVNVDSPTTINHYSAPAQRRSPLGTLARTAVALGLLGTGVGAGAAIPLVLDVIENLKDKAGPTIINTEKAPRYLLELGEPVTE